MKIEIIEWKESKQIEKLVAYTIKKFRSVRKREEYLKSKGFNVRFSYLREYKGVGKCEDYFFSKGNYIERRIIVGRPYNTCHRTILDYRPSRSAICVILRVGAEMIKFKRC